MSEPTKFCKDCKFARKAWTLPMSCAVCGHPSAVILKERYLVTADASDRKYCTAMRLDHGPCGFDAKLWEPRR